MSNAITLGEAYVQIMPSAKGIEKNIGKLLDPASATAGKSAGEKAGSNFGSAIKGMLLAAGIGKAVSMAFTEGANLQQNLGGTEAVFGEFANSIQASATDAYKNMGLSASEYMATANKMGSLFQGSGIEQEKALSLTSDAMQRAADVASVMGIDSSVAMESIAGAAKNNFTMMDNLGVAMNATTLQAYALEKGMNFKWNTASNAEKTELAMQMFMDRTSQYQGNFARESEETLSGSLGAMKSVFKDVLANLTLGRDIMPSLEALASTTVTFLVKNLLPAILNIIKALPVALITLISEFSKQLIPIGSNIVDSITSGMSSKLPVIATNLMNGILKAKDFITAELPGILSKGIEIITNLANGILAGLPKIISCIGPIMQNLLNTLYSAFPMILDAGFKLVTNLINGIIQNGPAIIVSIYETMSQILFTIASNMPALFQKGIEILGQLAAGLIQAIPTLIGKIPGIVAQTGSAFLSYDWGSIGLNIIGGIVKGLMNAAGRIIETLLNIAKDAFNAVLNFFGIHSPSRKFVFVGEMLDMGLAKGLLDKEKVVQNAMNRLSRITTGKLESELALKAGYGVSAISNEATNENNSKNRGYNQNINIYSPIALNPSEVSRQVRNSTRRMVLTTQGKV